MAKIMLVEDDRSLMEIYTIRLRAEGYDVVTAGDGEEALAVAVKEKPDLILSDVMMPKISGFDMLDILRQTPETKAIRVIMMTALSSDDQRQRGESLGADKYLVKSQVGIEDVVRAVHEMLGDTPATAPAATLSADVATVPASATTVAEIPTPTPSPATDAAPAATSVAVETPVVAPTVPSATPEAPIAASPAVPVAPTPAAPAPVAPIAPQTAAPAQPSAAPAPTVNPAEAGSVSVGTTAQ